jgi:protein TonB
MAVPAIPISGLGGAVKSPALLKSVEAKFPKDMRRPNLDINVLIQTLVTEDGLPSRTFVLVPVGNGFDEKAVEAVNQYKFRPAMIEGVPVPTLLTVGVRFQTF